MPKVILTTGGTGGHIFPALAVARALGERGIETLFIGATYGQEAILCARAQIPFVGLPGRGFLGRGLRAIPAAIDLGMAYFMALKETRRFRPDAIAAFGGYAAFAPALAAASLGVPLLVHEQNAVAGASNRILSRLARTVCASFPATRGLKSAIVTGNPVRADIHPRQPGSRPGLNLLVLGGSQGAHALNAAVVKMLPDLAAAGIKIRHQCGERDLAMCRDAYGAAGMDPECVSAFIDDMGAAYAWADLAFCRAGASTLAELWIAGLPAILTPFPAAIHDHQTLNAQAMVNAGGAILLPEPEIAKAPALICGLARDRDRLEGMAQGSLSLAKPDSANLVAEEIGKLIG